MGKKFMLSMLSFILLIGVASGADVSANSIQDKIDNIREEQKDVSGEKDDATKVLDGLKADEQTVKKQIEQLDGKIQQTMSSVRSKEEDVKKTEQEVKQLEKEIATLEKKINERDTIIKNRLVSLQENGGSISFMSVILGANSIGDFLSRMTAVNTLIKADQEIMDQQKSDKESLADKKQNVEAKLKKIQDSLSQLKTLQSTLEAQQAEKDAALEVLKKKSKDVQEKILSLEEQERILASQKRVAEQELAAWKAAQQAAGGNSNPGAYPTVTSGDFMRPAVGAVTSEFGSRWGSMHYGIDIGGGGQSGKPIVASADGTVISSYYSSSYGNVVFITHNIRGRVFTTVYAHMQSRGVSEGQRVSKGQFIGYMGSTGYSTGIHLHFELHEGLWNNSKSNAVNPRKYINF